MSVLKDGEGADHLNDNKGRRFMQKTLLSEEILASPEFKAFATRFGIPTDLNTKRLVIDLEAGHMMAVEQTYLTGDERAEEE